MDFKDIKSLDKNDLMQKITQSKRDLIDLKLKNSMGRLENPILIRKARRQIAKLLTAASMLD